jgi:4-amino-4-deoxy-L-arabinose transferase-like glycosyltransferase
VDLYGNAWPLLYFNKQGDYPPVLPFYISSLGTFFFGATIFGARFMTAVIGALTIFPVFFISLWTFKNKKTAFFSAILLAITPWHVAFSRISAEGLIATTVYIYGIWALLAAVHFKKKLLFLTLSAVLLFLTYFLYPSFRIIVPLTFLASFIFVAYKRQTEMKKMIIPLIVLTVLAFALTGFISTTNWGKGRLSQTSYLADFSNGKNPNIQFFNDEKYPTLGRIFHNKFVYVSREFVKQYFYYFAPSFLFVEGGHPDWFAVPLTGLFYLTCFLLLLPIFIRGASLRDMSIDKKNLLFLVLLVFISPIPAALTSELTPNVHRSILLSVTGIFIFSYGFYLFVEKFKNKKIVYAGIGILLSIEFLFFFHNYFQHESSYTAILRGDGNKQAVEYIQQNKTKYKKVYMMASGLFPTYYLYFTNNFDTKLIPEFRKNLRISGIENITFVDNDCLPEYPPIKIEPDSLVIMNCSEKKAVGLTKIDEIKAAGNNTVYYVYKK